MDMSGFATRLVDIQTRRTNRMIESTATYMNEMRQIVLEAETDTRMATNEMLGDDIITSDVEESSPQEIARGIFA